MRRAGVAPHLAAGSARPPPRCAGAPGFETRCPTRWCDGPCTLWTGCTQCPDGFESYRNSIGQLLCRPLLPPPLSPPPPRPPSPHPPPPAKIGTLFSGRAGSGGGVVASGAGFACPFPVLSPWQRRYYASISRSQVRCSGAAAAGAQTGRKPGLCLCTSCGPHNATRSSHSSHTHHPTAVGRQQALRALRRGALH